MYHAIYSKQKSSKHCCCREKATQRLSSSGTTTVGSEKVTQRASFERAMSSLTNMRHNHNEARLIPVTKQIQDPND